MKERVCRLRHTVHEVRYEDLEVAFGGDVVGHDARVGERPAEGVGNDDHDGFWRERGGRVCDICISAVEDGYAALGRALVDGACEAAGAGHC